MDAIKNFFRIIGFGAIVVGLLMFYLDYDIGGIIAIIGAILVGVTFWWVIVAIVGFLIKIFFYDNDF